MQSLREASFESVAPEVPEVLALPNHRLDDLYLPWWSWGDDPAEIVAWKVSEEENAARLDAEAEKDRLEGARLERESPQDPSPDWDLVQDRLERGSLRRC